MTALPPDLLADVAAFFRARSRVAPRVYRPIGSLAQRGDGAGASSSGPLTTSLGGGWRETEPSTDAERAPRTLEDGAGASSSGPLTTSPGARQPRRASVAAPGGEACGREGREARTVPAEEAPAPSLSAPTESAEEAAGFPLGKSDRTIDSFHSEIKDCVKCALGHSRTRFVFGVGNPNAALMLVGEAPGREEDLQGIPFVGAAGELLTKILAAIGLARDDVYIANVLKCRPPGNRDPLPEEIAACRPHLMEQIRLVSPRILCALGRFAAQLLTGQEAPLSRLRGQVFAFGDAIVIPTYHPSALLRNPSLKRPTWEDMKRVRARLDALGPR